MLHIKPVACLRSDRNLLLDHNQACLHVYKEKDSCHFFQLKSTNLRRAHDVCQRKQKKIHKDSAGQTSVKRLPQRPDGSVTYGLISQDASYQTVFMSRSRWIWQLAVMETTERDKSNKWEEGEQRGSEENVWNAVEDGRWRKGSDKWNLRY